VYTILEDGRHIWILDQSKTRRMTFF